jgi:putative endonuclease
MTEKIKKGQEAEELAANYLQEKGFRILERNFRYKHCEVDLIVLKENWLIFVEVKMRSSVAFGPPEIFVDRNKRHHVRKASRHYIFNRNWLGNIRFDIIAITRMDDEEEIMHIEDAFW